MKIKTKRYYIYYLVRSAVFMLGLLPLRLSLLYADLLGKAAFALVKRHSETAVNNLHGVLGGDRKKSETIARDVFSNLAKNGAEWMKLTSMRKNDLDRLVTEVEGLENLKEVCAKGRGAVALGSHFGNWELIPIYIASAGFKGGVVARRIYFQRYDKFITDLRKRFNFEVIYTDESPKKILRMLKSGGVIGILADQDVNWVEGVFVNFFGKRAYTPTAPVKLAMAASTDIVPTFMVRKKDNTHKLIVEKPIEIKRTGDDQNDIIRYTQAWTDVLERYIRKYPEQWVWMHKRWKTQEA